jgi:uncharacterized membrane protein HdeD (DUF308 family)
LYRPTTTSSILFGLLAIVAGIVALAWPGPTVLVLVLIVGIWAVAGGVTEFFAAFRTGEMAGTRATFLLGGLVSVAFGVVVLARPGLGAVTLALLFGLFTFVYGVWQLTLGFHLHSAR